MGSPCLALSLSYSLPLDVNTLQPGPWLGLTSEAQLRLLNFQQALANLMGPCGSSFPEGGVNSLLCMGTFLKFHQGDAGAKRDGDLVLQCGESCFQLNEAPFFSFGWCSRKKAEKSVTEGIPGRGQRRMAFLFSLGKLVSSQPIAY